MRDFIPSAFIALAISLSASAVLGAPKLIPQDFSNGSAQFVRPQAYLAATLSDESDGSARMAAKPAGMPRFSVSGFDVINAKQASAASANPGSLGLSGKSAKLTRPQYVAATTLSDESESARFTRPQYVAATTLSDESGSARLMRPQFVLDTSNLQGSSAQMVRPQAVLATTFSDESAGSARMSVEPGNSQVSVSGFDIVKADLALHSAHASSQFDLSAVNYGNRAKLLGIDTTAK
jgi:hypothetical protein